MTAYDIALVDAKYGHRFRPDRTGRVSVLVPYRPDGGDRDEAWAYARRWWADTHPDWQVITGTCPDGPWVKALAVAGALTQADGDVLVVADADVIVPGVDVAVHALTTRAAWAIPHQRVHRLGRAASQALYSGGPLPVAAGPRARPEGVYASYKGVAGGGCVALSRAMYDLVPLDPRFVGWGQEDQSWARALEVVAGPAWRDPAAPLWHLWHPPATRGERAIGSPEGAALFRRYRATGTPAAMLALLDEFRYAPVPPSGETLG